jgi:hypothetical protein
MRSDEQRGLRTESESFGIGSPSRIQSSALSPQSLEIHIEELVLHGFAPGDRHRIGEAVERELVRLFTDQGVPASLSQGSDVARLDGGDFNVVAGSKPQEIGVQVAQALYGGFNR